VPKNAGFPPIVLITAFGDEETHSLAENLGAAAMFDKPFSMDDLLAKVHELLPLNKNSGGNQK
jgi:DNA-binding response OmpR family regulator